VLSYLNYFAYLMNSIQSVFAFREQIILTFFNITI